MEEPQPMPPHWYMSHCYECPVCGHFVHYIKRVYGENPPHVEDRCQYENAVCNDCT